MLPMERLGGALGDDEVMKNLAYIGYRVHRFSNFLLNIDGPRLPG